MDQANLKSAMGLLSVAIMIAAYSIYIWQTARSSDIRPHPFSWTLWGIVTAVVWRVQVTQGAGAGSWVVGLTAFICLAIGFYSLFKYSWKFSWFDWASLITGLAVLVFYLYSRNATWSAVLATLTDLIGYAATVRRGWFRPRDDSAVSFALNSAKFVPSLFALETLSLATWIYPAALVFANGAVALMLVVRRRQVDGLQ